MAIVVRGARTHNLRAVDVALPTQRLVAITGPSGAGKSSLAFDTIYAEAQRRFVESLAADARAALERLPRPDVDAIEGLSPAIAIAQKPIARSPRSTVGTVTEISDHLRLAYARLGEPRCPICGAIVRAETPQRIVDAALASAEGTKVTILAPILRGAREGVVEALDRLRKDGFVRAQLDGAIVALDPAPKVDAKKAHDLDAVIDRVVVKADRDAMRPRLGDSIELALRTGDGKAILARDPGETTTHSERFACENDGFTFPPIEPRLFSFNSPYGACPTCEGVGEASAPSEARVIPDASRTLREGAIAAWGAPTSVAYAVALKEAVDATGADPDVAWSKLAASTREAILRGGVGKKKKAYLGVLPWIAARLAGAIDDDEEGSLEEEALAEMLETAPCPTCKGARLREAALAVFLAGKNIAEVGAMTIPAARAQIERVAVEVPSAKLAIAKPIVEGILARLRFLEAIGLHYLAIDRAVSSMSGGEVARMRLATQLAGRLSGVLYVLDEPTVGLHARDTNRLIEALRGLVDIGNTVLVVEHDLAVLRASDEIVDLVDGRIVAQGPSNAIATEPASVTAPWIDGRAALPALDRKGFDRERVIALKGATLHNLHGVDAEIPLGLLVAVTGVSGSGKSSLVDVLVPALRRALATRGKETSSAHHRSIAGFDAIERVVLVDQSPIGRTPRSTAATHVGVMAKLRELFASLPSAKARGWKPGRFSSNVKGGRCEECRGEGVVRVEMSFLPDVFVVCDTCNGARFNRETLEVRYRGHSIADVLAMTVDDAHHLFEAIPPVRERLAALRNVGLGYLKLGQSATTLSGGEAQRVKLATALVQPAFGPAKSRSPGPPGGGSGKPSLYVFDEPTTGLHPIDVAVLLRAFAALREAGHTLVVIEHDLAFVARCDWVIDLGPEAGEAGGKIVAVGAPEEIAKAKGSVTAGFLRSALGGVR